MSLEVSRLQSQWQQSVWPIAREAFFSAASVAIASHLDWWDAPHYLEGLLDPDVPFRQMGLLLLAAGLAAKGPAEQGMAIEALIAGIADWRLDGHTLGSMMAQVWPTGLIKMARWAKALADAARVSPLHAQVIFDAIEWSLQGDADTLPRDSHALLDLFKELGVETGSRVGWRELVRYSPRSSRPEKPARPPPRSWPLLTCPIHSGRLP